MRDVWIKGLIIEHLGESAYYSMLRCFVSSHVLGAGVIERGLSMKRREQILKGASDSERGHHCGSCRDG